MVFKGKYKGKEVAIKILKVRITLLPAKSVEFLN